MVVNKSIPKGIRRDEITFFSVSTFRKIKNWFDINDRIGGKGKYVLVEKLTRENDIVAVYNITTMPLKKSIMVILPYKLYNNNLVDTSEDSSLLM